jgi:hypothetical protein
MVPQERNISCLDYTSAYYCPLDSFCSSADIPINRYLFFVKASIKHWVHHAMYQHWIKIIANVT